MLNLRKLDFDAKSIHKPGSREWFQLKKDGDVPEVFIYDEIGRGFFGGGVAAEDFIKSIKELKLKASDELRVRINSPGGDLFDGNAIYNYLSSLKAQVTVRIDGVAASAASIIAMAGDTVEMPENAMLFIHNPWMMAIGDSRVMRKVADDLDKMRDAAVLVYERRTNGKLERAELVKMLDEETWLSAAESVEHGFADVVDEPVRAAALAQFDLQRYGFPLPAAYAEARTAMVEDKQKKREQLRALVV